MLRKTLMTLLAVLLALPLPAQEKVVTTPEDVALAESIMEEQAAHLRANPDATTPELMLLAARRLLGQPYVAGTLDQDGPEALRIYLTQTDCILFVETVFNLAETVQDGATDFDSFAAHVRQTRYRGGVVDGYGSRIHYTSEWIRQGEVRGVLKELSADYGALRDRPLNFMSKNSRRYRQLQNAAVDPAAAEALKTIAAVEKTLSAAPQYYIPQDQIKAMEGHIRSGDIIGFTAATPGLDVAHVAIACVHDGKVGFIHASLGQKAVIIDPRSIADYALAAKGITGIRLIRALR